MVRNIFFALVAALLFFTSCREKPTPRPYAYYRVDLAPNEYADFHLPNFPYRFNHNTNSVITERFEKDEKYWIDIYYPQLDAYLYCSYKALSGNLFDLAEESRKIVYKHSIRANEIAEVPYENIESGVYGLLYELTGNVASPAQFVLTDSTKHFFRAALYFESTPNSDSIAPMLEYVNRDIIQMIESFEWNY